MRKIIFLFHMVIFFVIIVHSVSAEQIPSQPVVPVKDTVTMVDLGANSCIPCKMMAPILDDIADEYADKVTLSKMNVDVNSVSPAKYGVRGIPTFLIFMNGELASTMVGAASKTQLKEFIDTALSTL